MLWIKAFHIVAMVTWFSGLFYLPRLFVYHAQASDEISLERFKIMERKLFNGITTPGMVITIGLGLWLLSLNPTGYMHQKWFHWKLLLVLMLIGYHFLCGYFKNRFARQQNTKTHVFYRVFNEIPVLFLIGIVALVVVKPI